jgi:hypothetical protein
VEGNKNSEMAETCLKPKLATRTLFSAVFCWPKEAASLAKVQKRGREILFFSVIQQSV